MITDTALENIILSLQLSGNGGRTKSSCLWIAGKVGIDRETANRRILKLSGGENQRVAIAVVCTITQIWLLQMNRQESWR
jgi:putative ABC transport system ATP-binding protein